MFSDSLVSRHTPKLIELLVAGEERKSACPPLLIQVVRDSAGHNQGTDQDIRVKDNAHLFPEASGSNCPDRFVNGVLYFFGRHVLIRGLGFRHSFVQYSPPNGVLHKFREVFFL
jgi:hypothetical protein